MEERLLEANNADIKKLVKRINEIIDKKFDILSKDDDIEKWNSVPKLLLLNDVGQKRLLSFLEYMDSLFTPTTEKTKIIISLSGLMEFANIKLYDYDDGSLYTMADYYKDTKIKNIQETILIAGNKDLLLAVRKKTLDLDIRRRILSEVVDKAVKEKIVSKKIDKLDEFINNAINELNEKDYYEL